MNTVAIVNYESPSESVRKAVELSDGLKYLTSNAKVFIKPNIVFWTKETNFPKWGVITTSRVVEDMVLLLKERGISDITIGEGIVMFNPKDVETPAHAFESLGYNALKKRYGVKPLNIFEGKFEKADLGDGVELAFNTDILHSDFVIDLPVLKTHAQTVISLGIKNLKGTIDIPSRKKCHSADPAKDLNFMISKLADKMPPMFTLIDGIYTNERGPSFDGRIRRRNILIASNDVLSADLVGAKALGYDVSEVPHLAHAAKFRNRSGELSDIEIVGESLADISLKHEYTFPYNQDNTLPLPMEKLGITGLSYRKYDSSLCTYCSGINGVILTAISYAWKKTPWEDVEVLTGKMMTPTPGKKKTILLGKCMYQANKNHPNINEMIAVKGCPPKPEDIVGAFHQAGIELAPSMFENIGKLPGFLMDRYKNKPEFEEVFFTLNQN